MNTDMITGEVKLHFVRDPYNFDRDVVSRETGLKCTDATRTQQHHKDECDINVIVKRFGVTGQLPIMATQPLQGDFTSIEDYQTMVERLREADANFMRLPSDVRDKFAQDPRKFVDFCLDPANIEAVRDMKLAPRPVVPVNTTNEVKNG